MNKLARIFTLAGALALASASIAAAGSWETVAQLSPGGDAKEVRANIDAADAVAIECTDGSIIVNTLWVRSGGSKRQIRVARRFNKGERAEFSLGGGSITGFRISDGGRGSYRILVKRARPPRRDDDRRHGRDWDRDRDHGRDRDWDRGRPPRHGDRRYYDDDDYGYGYGHPGDYRRDWRDDAPPPPPPPSYRPAPADDDSGSWLWRLFN